MRYPSCRSFAALSLHQAAMAVRLDSQWARPPAASPHQVEAVPSATAATVAAALSLLDFEHQPGGCRQDSGQLGAISSPHAAHSQAQSPQGAPVHAPAGLQPGVEQVLLSAHAAFLRCSRALRGAGGHSSYQRAMANCLTGMRTMHVLEDSSSGRRTVACWSWGCSR